MSYHERRVTREMLESVRLTQKTLHHIGPLIDISSLTHSRTTVMQTCKFVFKRYTLLSLSVYTCIIIGRKIYARPFM